MPSHTWIVYCLVHMYIVVHFLIILNIDLVFGLKRMKGAFQLGLQFRAGRSVNYHLKLKKSIRVKNMYNYNSLL